MPDECIVQMQNHFKTPCTISLAQNEIGSKKDRDQSKLTKKVLKYCKKHNCKEFMCGYKFC